MTKLLTRDAILAAKVPTEEVFVEEWGGSVLLRPITVRIRARILDAIDAREKEVAAYEADQTLPADERKGVAKVEPLDQTIVQVIMAVVDENLDPLFTVEDDYERFADLSLPTISMLYSTLMAMQRRERFARGDKKKAEALP